MRSIVSIALPSVFFKDAKAWPVISLRYLIAYLFFVFSVPQFLMLGLNGYVHIFASALIAMLLSFTIAGIVFLHLERFDSRLRIDVFTLLVCVAAGAVLCILGGQGRLFYANPDWQIRDALLNDLVRQPWPFIYRIAHDDFVLRAPVGIYLAPALIGKVAGLGIANFAFLAQNTLILGSLFALTLIFFAGFKQRAVALVSIIIFSGLDIIGYAIKNLLLGRPFHPDHIEHWSGLFQYSSTITQIFWVPNHCFPAFYFGALYVLWLDKRVSASLPLAAVPLLGIWSPLSMIGALPFAVHVCVKTLKNGGVNLRLIALPFLTTAISVWTIVYLQSGTEGVPVGFGLRAGSAGYPVKGIATYLLFVSLEVIPFLLVLLFSPRRPRFGVTSFVIVSAILFVAPLIYIGPSMDFCMRASLPALLILTVTFSDQTVHAVYHGAITFGRAFRFSILMLLAIGSVTGILEVKRALTLPPASVTCNLVDTWLYRQAPGDAVSFATYLAPVQSLLPIFQPMKAAVVVSGIAHNTCWTAPWITPQLK